MVRVGLPLEAEKSSEWLEEAGGEGLEIRCYKSEMSSLSHKTLGSSLDFNLLYQAGSFGRILIRGTLDGQNSCFLPLPSHKDPYN